jgi:hypothetical protein
MHRFLGVEVIVASPAKRGISLLAITRESCTPALNIHFMKISTIRTVWSSRSQSMSSIHFQTLFHAQPESMTRVRATSSHFFILFLLWDKRDQLGRRSVTDNTSLKQGRQVRPNIKPVSSFLRHQWVIISNSVDFFNSL